MSHLISSHRAADEKLWPVEDPFILKKRASESDIDDFGHVNNLRYVEWVQNVAWAHSTSLGMSQQDFVKSGVVLVVQRHEFDYKNPVLVGEDILIATWITDNDQRLRVKRAYQMRRAKDGVLVFSGITRFVSVEFSSGKPARMPPCWRGVFKTSPLID